MRRDGSAVSVEALENRQLLAAAPAWAAGLGGPGEDSVSGVTTDRAGNVYLTGQFSGKVDFDFSASGTTVLNGLNGSGFVAKYTAVGDLVWARPIQLGSIGAFVQSVVVDRAGGVYLAGDFEGTVDFDPSRFGQENLTATAHDAFVLKLDADGDFVWARRLPTTDGLPLGGDTIELAFGAGDDLFVTGKIAGPTILDGNRPFLARLTRSSGNIGLFRDLREDLPGRASRAAAIATDRDGNPVIVGSDEESGGSFAAKYDRNGVVTWTQAWGGNDQGAKAIAVDSRGTVYVAGEFGGTQFGGMTLSPSLPSLQSFGGRDVYVVRLDPAGEIVWGRQLGGGATDGVTDLLLDTAGNVVVSGTFIGAADFDPRRGSFVLNAGASQDAFVATLTPGGNFVSAFAIGGKRATVFGRQIAMDRGGALIAAATFDRAVDANPGSGSLVLRSTEDSFDVLLGRYTL
ncbi:MAG TPA: SBBP repeat-containing protein [Tepidisphaeraceae bacterium]|nr:SBBP repeat-containing protein [Tepidisphaeraceae bacterium]